MTACFLDRIDWRQPWLAPLQSAAAPMLAATDWRDALDRAAATRDVRNHRGLPIHFVPQADLPPGMAYEAFISATGFVPTRDNLHDFFNALVWLTFPQAKVRLNALQAAEIARAGSHTRGKVRDGATIFDENAALLITRDPGLVEALRAHRWHDAFVARRQDFWRGSEVRLFGHALMEKLMTPYKAITAHAWIVPADETFFTLSRAAQTAWIDEALAAQLADGLTTAGFTPLPVAGIPGWWRNQDEAFYADAAVFRPQRTRSCRPTGSPA